MLVEVRTAVVVLRGDGGPRDQPRRVVAAAVGLELGLTGGEIARGIAEYHTVGDRARVIHAPEYTVVSDCYNANPNSCRAALDSLAGLPGRRVCVLGDMLELGGQSPRLHAEVGAYAAKRGIELILGCGPLARHIVDGARAAGGEALYFADKAALLDALDGLIRPGDSVLVKASRSMAFEAIVERLTGQ